MSQKEYKEGLGWSAEKEAECIDQQRYFSRPKAQKDKEDKDKDRCPHLPGTILRIFIPPGAVINLLNLIELTSPSGICIIVRVPLLCKEFDLASIVDTVKKVGGSVEVLPQ